MRNKSIARIIREESAFIDYSSDMMDAGGISFDGESHNDALDFDPAEYLDDIQNDNGSRYLLEELRAESEQEEYPF